MNVSEIIHHGNYYNFREDWVEPTLEDFVRFLKESPYATGVMRVDNRYVVKAFKDLRSTGKASFGWARYEAFILPDTVDSIKARDIESGYDPS